MSGTIFSTYRRRFVTAAIVFVVSATFVATVGRSQNAEPAPNAKGHAGKRTFRLTDGTELPIDEWPETYEADEWQPPVDTKKAKTIIEYPFGMDRHFYSVTLDHNRRKVYWISAANSGGNGWTGRSNLDGSGQQMLIDHHTLNISYPTTLCMLPKLGKIYWLSGNGPRSMFRADLDGTRVEEVFKGLQATAYKVVIDPNEEMIYWNDNGRLMRGNPDGTDETECGAKVFPYSAFDIDFQHGQVYGNVHLEIARQALDGKGLVSLFHSIGYVSKDLARALTIDRSDGYLYWSTKTGIVRARLGSPANIEGVTEHCSPFCVAIDDEHKRLYWSVDTQTGQKLLSAALPPPWRTMVKPAPPLITSLEPSAVAAGQSVLVHGAGLKTAQQVWWIGLPTGERAVAKFQVLSDTELRAMMPKLSTRCTEAAMVITAEGGATVTLPRQLTLIREVVLLERSAADRRRILVVQSKGKLQKAENRIILLDRGGFADDDVRGANTFFVKNGAKVALGNPGSLVFHEPHAEIALRPGEQVDHIAVGAIRPSYVEGLVKIVPDRP